MNKRSASYAYFSNTACEYFPCHGIEDQNCLFCYCPLYQLDCGGSWSLSKGFKDCSACTIVHEEGGYEFVQEKLKMPFFTLGMPSWFPEFLSSRNDDFSQPRGRMQLAVDLSAENVRRGTGGPFGAAVFRKDDLVACGVNRVERDGQAIAHAEIMALGLAQKKTGSYDLGPEGLELATSSQPCSMCYGASIWSGIHSLLIGARREDVEELAGFDEGPIPPDWQAELGRRGITVQTDILRDEAREVLVAYEKSGGTVYNSSANKLGKRSSR